MNLNAALVVLVTFLGLCAAIHSLCAIIYRAGYVDGIAASVNFVQTSQESCETEKRIIVRTLCSDYGRRM